jgi:hypothetical protein
MKRTRTLVSYFSQAVPEQQGGGEQQATATPSPALEQQNVQASTLQSQGTEEESIRTRASAAQAQNQYEEVITVTATTSLPAVDLIQPPVEQPRNENVDFVEEGGGSNHVLDPQDIIADPGCRKPIEEMQKGSIFNFCGGGGGWFQSCYVERAVFATIQNDDILRHFQELKPLRRSYLVAILLVCYTSNKLLLFLLTFTCQFPFTCSFSY